MNTATPLDPDDPRLSAFVLGELPADEALIISAKLRHSPEARAEVEAMQEMADLLRDSFAGELEDAPPAETPTLSLLPFDATEEKIVPFTSLRSDEERRIFRMKVITATSLAAALAMGLFLLPEIRQAGGGNGEAMAGAGDSTLPEGSFLLGAVPVSSSLLDGRETNLSGYVLEELTPEVDSYQQPGPAVETPLSMPIPATGPTLKQFRFSENPLPASRASYIDARLFPGPELIGRQVELSGGVFSLDGEKGRALYRSERSIDSSGRTSVIIEGMVRLEPETDALLPPAAPTGGFQVNVEPLSFSAIEGEGAFEASPSSYISLSGVEADEGIAERELAKISGRIQDAKRLAESAEAAMTVGDQDKAVTDLKAAIETLPGGEATRTIREELARRLAEIEGR